MLPAQLKYTTSRKDFLLKRKFYDRSRDTTSFDVLEADSLISVQILLLRSLYLQSTNNAQKCWNTVGLAIRAAQGLGLHLDESSTGWRQSPLEREMRKRIWHVCVLLDRLVSVVKCLNAIRQPFAN
jgi:hypothetical protein